MPTARAEPRRCGWQGLIWRCFNVIPHGWTARTMPGHLFGQVQRPTLSTTLPRAYGAWLSHRGYEALVAVSWLCCGVDGPGSEPGFATGHARLNAEVYAWPGRNCLMVRCVGWFAVAPVPGLLACRGAAACRTRFSVVICVWACPGGGHARDRPVHGSDHRRVEASAYAGALRGKRAEVCPAVRSREHGQVQ